MSTSTPPTRPPALLARVADGLAVAAGVLAVFVLVFGGFVVYGPVPLRVHGVGRILFIAAAIVAIRHAAYPSIRCTAGSRDGSARATPRRPSRSCDPRWSHASRCCSSAFSRS